MHVDFLRTVSAVIRRWTEWQSSADSFTCGPSHELLSVIRSNRWQQNVGGKTPIVT